MKKRDQLPEPVNLLTLPCAVCLEPKPVQPSHAGIWAIPYCGCKPIFDTQETRKYGRNLDLMLTSGRAAIIQYMIYNKGTFNNGEGK